MITLAFVLISLLAYIGLVYRLHIHRKMRSAYDLLAIVCTFLVIGLCLMFGILIQETMSRDINPTVFSYRVVSDSNPYPSERNYSIQRRTVSFTGPDARKMVAGPWNESECVDTYAYTWRTAHVVWLGLVGASDDAAVSRLRRGVKKSSEVPRVVMEYNPIEL